MKNSSSFFDGVFKEITPFYLGAEEWNEKNKDVIYVQENVM